MRLQPSPTCLCSSPPERPSVIRALEPGHDWVWCYLDERSLRNVEGEWQEVDLFFETGLAYMEKHVDEGGTADVGPDVMAGNGFPVGAWVLEMRRRGESGDLGGAHVRLLEQLPGWRWNG